MPETFSWMPDGTHCLPHLDNRHPHDPSAPHPSPQIFLEGCGLPQAWASQAQWRILETCFGFGLNFLATWAAWKADPQRPRMLHFVSIHAHPVSRQALQESFSAHEALHDLGEQLARQWWGLLPGVHRLSFEEGQVLLTLYIGDGQTMLRKQQMTADSLYCNNAWPLQTSATGSDDAAKNMARHCRRGTRLTATSLAEPARQSLIKQGFEVPKSGTPAQDHPHFQACYSPRWEPRQRPDGMPEPIHCATSCLVLGAGLAGAATAASLARRGWHVTVLDQAALPAAGASGLPAGLFCPHVSPDDSVLSRLSRSGVRTTLQTLQQLSHAHMLQPDQDWAFTGVLEHDLNEPAHLPPAWQSDHATDTPWGLQWSHPATEAQLQAAYLPKGSHAVWHAQAGWVRPASLVRALLQHPRIQWQGQAEIQRLQRDASSGLWQALSSAGQILAQAPMLVLALGPATRQILQDSKLAAAHWELLAIRGQVSVAAHVPQTQAAMPPFPVNGHGNLVPNFPAADSGGTRQWVMGSTFERDVTQLPPTAVDQRAAHASNGDKLAALLPACKQALQSFFEAPDLPETWARIRCAAYDRLPLTGGVGQTRDEQPGLWVLTGLGSRGLTLSMLCGELLAARLHGEPLPLDGKLAQALGTQRLWSRTTRHKPS